MGEVLSLVDQALVQVAGEQRNAIGPRVVAKEMAGHADLVAAAGVEQLLIEPRPGLNRLRGRGLQPGDVGLYHNVFLRAATPIRDLAILSAAPVA